jgi:glucosamine--fructose-6-phosphate aminotransferase (isomerizing)
VEQCLALSEEIRDLAAVCSEYRSMYFLGRERYWAPAREGAQKLKEITYIHAEAYQSTELKHGPLSLVSEDHLSILLVGPGQFHAGVATVELLRSRGGRTIAVVQGNSDGIAADHVLRIPSLDPSVDGLLAGVALQLLAYHCAGILGRDVDRPRNLAKSVTV